MYSEELNLYVSSFLDTCDKYVNIDRSKVKITVWDANPYELSDDTPIAVYIASWQSLASITLKEDIDHRGNKLERMQQNTTCIISYPWDDQMLTGDKPAWPIMAHVRNQDLKT
jgi:hypothetical protein